MSCISKRRKISRFFCWVLFVAWGIQSLVACQDFNRFDCFNEEQGCKPTEANIGGDVVGSTPIQMANTDMALRESVMANTDMAPRGSVMANTDMAPMMSTECEPFEPIGPCRSCNAQGQIEFTQVDEGCQPIICDPVNYEILPSNTADSQLCQMTRYLSKDSLCDDNGVCIDSIDSYCMIEEQSAIEMDLDNRCIAYSGCQNNEPQQVIPTNIGLSCNGNQGTCNSDGTCLPNQNCAPVEAAHLCSSDPNHCIYSATLGFGLGIIYPSSCDVFCENLNGSCVAAWAEGNNRCSSGQTRGCSQQGGTNICKCQIN